MLEFGARPHLVVSRAKNVGETCFDEGAKLPTANGRIHAIGLPVGVWSPPHPKVLEAVEPTKEHVQADKTSIPQEMMKRSTGIPRAKATEVPRKMRKEPGRGRAGWRRRR